MNENNPWQGPAGQPYPQEPFPPTGQWQQGGGPMFPPAPGYQQAEGFAPSGVDPYTAPWSPPPRNGKKWLFAGAAAFVAVLLVGGGIVAWNLRSGSAGASSPENAALDALAAVEGQDPLKFTDAIAPGELDGLSDILETTHEKAEDAGLQDGGGVGGLLQGISVATDNVHTETEMIRDDLAKVTFTSGTATVGFDPAETNPGIRDIIGDEVSADEETADIRDFDAETSDGDPIDPFVMTVKVDGRWYLSPLYTIGEYASVGLGEPRVDDPQVDTQEYRTPEEAAEGFVDAVVDAIENRDITALTETLPAHVGRAVATYQPVLERTLDDDELDSRIEIDILDSSYSSEIRGSRATVTIDTLRMAVTADGERGTVEVDGDCVEVTDPEGDRDELCGDAADILMGPGTGDVGLTSGITVVEDGSGWHVDPVTTLLTSGLRSLEAVTTEQLLYLLGVEGDVIEVYLNADADAELEIGGSTTVEPQSPLDVDGANGVAIVDIDVEAGRTVRVSAESEYGHVRLGLVSTGGRADYDVDYSGDERVYEFTPVSTGTAKLVVIVDDARAGDEVRLRAE